MNINKIIISRTDKIGDVILTLPVAGILREHYPKCEILFIGESYTQPIINACDHVDTFINWSELKKKSREAQVESFRQVNADVIVHVFPNKDIARVAQKAKIPLRIGTGHRIYHLLTCNKRLFFSRKKSGLHESQLNLKLLKPLQINSIPPREKLSEYYGLSKTPPLDEKHSSFLSTEKTNLILHPKSKGSAREWGLDNFGRLIDLLPSEKYNILISGTKEDRTLLEGFLSKYSEKTTDLTGRMSLEQFIAFISRCDALVAASTGPLHIAAALGLAAIGIFPPIRPMHPGRWAPLGKKAHALVLDKECNKCRKTLDCDCIKKIKPEEVVRALEKEQ